MKKRTSTTKTVFKKNDKVEIFVPYAAGSRFSRGIVESVKDETVSVYVLDSGDINQYNIVRIRSR